MVKIVIYDNEQKCVESLEKCIGECLEEKNVQYEILDYSLYKGLQEEFFSQDDSGQISLPFVGGNKKIEINNIIYIESVAHKVIFHVYGGEMQEYYMYMKLDEMELLFDNYRFVRIHKSYLINPNYVKEFNQNSVKLLGVNKKLPISRRREVEAKKRFNISKE